MKERLSFFIIDDDKDIQVLLRNILEKARHDVTTFNSGVEALDQIKKDKPDCIITDVMMATMDGIEFIIKIRKNKDLDNIKIIVLSAKVYESDKKRCFSVGADGYFVKPINSKQFMEEVEEIILQKIELTFWGVRGTLPVPGKKAIKYGGNTTCLSILFPKNRLFILDAGTGIKELSNYLLASGKANLNATFFISHSHWDHINAFPFFVPLYITGNEFQVCGPAQGHLSIREIVSNQMDGVYFPITVKEFSSHLYFKDLVEDSYEINNINIKTKLLVHPGCDLGYRFEYNGKSICSLTDNELYLHDSKSFSKNIWNGLVEFVQGADILIHDTTYTLEEYEKKINWGHSCVDQVVKLAIEAKVGMLYMSHHDPDQTDNDIDHKVEIANKIIADYQSPLKCACAVEQNKIII